MSSIFTCKNCRPEIHPYLLLAYSTVKGTRIKASNKQHISTAMLPIESVPERCAPKALNNAFVSGNATVHLSTAINENPRHCVFFVLRDAAMRAIKFFQVVSDILRTFVSD